MKNKVIPFIIGVLVGAIITSVGFIIYMNANKGKFDGDRPKMERFDKDGNFDKDSFNKDGKNFPERPNKDKPNSNENKAGDTTNNTENKSTDVTNNDENKPAEAQTDRLETIPSQS